MFFCFFCFFVFFSFFVFFFVFFVFLPPPTATSPENCSPTNFCKLASNSPPVGPLTLVVTAPFSAMDIFTLYSILPVDCDFSTSPENVTGLYAGGFAVALATGLIFPGGGHSPRWPGGGGGVGAGAETKGVSAFVSSSSFSSSFCWFI